MTQLHPPSLERVLGRFPWRRRKPRGSQDGSIFLSTRSSDGQEVWAALHELAGFSDPGPALAYVALRSDREGHALVRALVAHHSASDNTDTTALTPSSVKQGVTLLEKLIQQAGLEHSAPVGENTLEDLVIATWAIAAAMPISKS